MVDEIFDLAELDAPTPEQVATIKKDITILNSLDIEGLKLEYDEESGEVLNVK